MRVLHITSTFARGGIATSLWHLLPELGSFGIEVEIAGLNEIGLYGERLQKHKIPATPLGFRTKYDTGAFARFVKWLRRERFDLIHAHGWPSIFFVALAAQFVPRARYFVTEHSVSNRRRRYNLKPLERWMYRRYERIISVSQAADTALRAWLPETAKRSGVIYNGISFARLKEGLSAPTPPEIPRQDNIPLILCASGSEYHKGADVLIDALATWQSRRNFILALAGAGRRDPELREHAQSVGVEKHTRWLGYVPDVVMQMNDADVFVLPSRREGCPMVILEAMAMRMPIVAAAVGGVPELIRDHESGIFVASENPAALGEAIDSVIRDRVLARKIGSAALERVDSFTAKRQAVSIAALYQHVTKFEYDRN